MQNINRRSFLIKLSAASGAGIAMTGVLSGCGGGESSETPAAEPEAEAPAAAAAEGSCMDTTGLTDAEAQMRETLGYVDSSPEADKNCLNCALYVAAEGGATCGGCTPAQRPDSSGGILRLLGNGPELGAQGTARLLTHPSLPAMMRQGRSPGPKSGRSFS